MAIAPAFDILIVEDEVNTNILTQRIKEEFRDNVRIHTNGHGLLSDLELFTDLDIIIVDQQYTKEDVVHSLKQIRKESPLTEVIVLSSESETISNIKKVGAYDYIYKDKDATDKVLYDLKKFWTKNRLQKETMQLNRRTRRSVEVAVIIVSVFFVIASLALNFLAK